MEPNRLSEFRHHIMTSGHPIEATFEEIQSGVNILIREKDEEKLLLPNSIRAYVQRYDDRRLLREQYYTDDTIAECRQVKDILKPRFQFNGRQREIYDYFVNNFHSEYEMSEKLAERTQELLNRDSLLKKGRNKRNIVRPSEIEEESCIQKFISELRGQASLTDSTKIKGEPWGDLKFIALQKQFRKSYVFVSVSDIV